MHLSTFFNVYINSLAIFLLKFPIIFTSCPYELAYLQSGLNTYNSTRNRTSHSFLHDTFICDKNLNQNFINNPEKHLIYCSDSDLDVVLEPHSVLPNGSNILPYITLNISTSIFIPLNELFIQFRCLNAPDQEDAYCHNHKSQSQKWGRMIWPCRELKFDMNDTLETNIPFKFSYNCFHLFGFSQYEVNITILPKFCRSTYILTIPMEKQLDPQIRQFYRGGEKWQNQKMDWSPLVYVETTSVNGVWIRFQAIPWIKLPKQLSVAIFRRFTNNSNTEFLRIDHIPAPKTGFRWENVPMGDYLIFVFVDRPDCKFSCGENPKFNPLKLAHMDSECKICPHTMLNFTITKDKFTKEWLKKETISRLIKSVFIAIFVLLFLSILSAIGVLFYFRYWRPKLMARRPAQQVELVARPTIFILYTDDCEEHTQTVMALQKLLIGAANARILIDQLDFQDSNIRPSIWLLNAISEADFILIIFSEASKRVINGEKLIQRRPFPDLFATAISYVIMVGQLESPQIFSSLEKKINWFWHEVWHCVFTEKINEKDDRNDEKLELENAISKRFLVARFSYSSANSIPEFFSSRKQFGCFLIPEELGGLIGCLHGHSINYNNTLRFEHEANVNPLNSAIRRFTEFRDSTPDYLTKRFEMISIPSSAKELKNRLEERFNKMPETSTGLEDHQIMAEKFGLLNPEEDDEISLNQSTKIENETDTGFQASTDNNKLVTTTSEAKKFQLIGTMEDFCSSSESIDS